MLQQFVFGRKMGDNDRFAATAAATAAALLGAYSLYKVFSSSDKIRVINNIADCRRDLNEIKKYVHFIDKILAKFV